MARDPLTYHPVEMVLVRLIPMSDVGYSECLGEAGVLSMMDPFALAGLLLVMAAFLFYWYSTQRELHYLRDLYAALFERSQDCVYTFNLDGQFIDANPAALALMGYDRSELRSVRLIDLVDPSQAALLKERLTEVRSAGKTTVPSEFCLLRKDGRQVFVESRAALVMRNGKPYAIQGIARDVTDRKRHDDLLRESEEKFRNLAEHMHAAVGIVQGARFVYVNQYMGEMLGYDVDEILKMDFPILVHPDDRARMIDYARRRQMGQEAPSHYEFRALTKAGETRWIDFSVASIAYLGRPAVVGTGFDFTARKQFEQALRENEARLEAHSRGVKLLADTGTRLLAAKCPRESLHEIFDELRQHLRIEMCWSYLLTGDGTHLRMHAHSGLEEAEARQFEYIALGQPFCGLVVQQNKPIVLDRIQGAEPSQLQPLRGLGLQVYACYPMVVHDSVIGAVAFASRKRDSFTPEELELIQAVSYQAALALEHQRLASELEARAAELLEANLAKDHFLAVLSHELRTPLTPALAAAGILERDEALPISAREDVQLIRRNVELEARLIDDLLDVTRIVRGKIELNKRAVELSAVLRHAIEVCREDIAARELHFAWKAEEGKSYWLLADPDRLQQVFWNLLKNAIKFTPHGGCVQVRSSQQADRAIIEVVDSGEGIPAEALARIFKPFEQAERSITRKFGGLGLGLAITRALVELHDGTISASSRGKGRGATFRVELPLASEEALHRQEPQGADLRTASSLGPQRTLLVEDHGDTAKVLLRLLRQAGHDVHHAADVATALQLSDEASAQGRPFQLLISDIGLPDGSGHDLMRQLRALGHHPAGIALSGFGMASDMQQSRDAGFAEHLTKPVNFADLQLAIARTTAVPAG